MPSPQNADRTSEGGLATTKRRTAALQWSHLQTALGAARTTGFKLHNNSCGAARTTVLKLRNNSAASTALGGAHETHALEEIEFIDTEMTLDTGTATRAADRLDFFRFFRK